MCVDRVNMRVGVCVCGLLCGNILVNMSFQLNVM